MDLYAFQKFKIIAYVSYKLILHYVNICKFFDKYLVRFKIKTFRSSHYDYIEFEIEHKENFEESVHKTFPFLETYYKKTQESKIFLATKYKHINPYREKTGDIFIFLQYKNLIPKVPQMCTYIVVLSIFKGFKVISQTAIFRFMLKYVKIYLNFKRL